jgi:hypothetical protein
MKLKRVLTLRMSGEDVTLLQTMLKEHGFFNERIDGNFGQNLLVSVTNFQRAIGTKADGIVGSITWNKLKNYGIPVLVQNEIPYEISYVNQNGLTVYNHSLSSDLYYQEDVKKETIWLHNTGGGSRPDWSVNGWEKEFEKDLSGDPILDQIGRVKPLKVGVSYIIGRKSSSIDEKIWDGKILNTFDDKYWAYHLGINNNQSLDLNSKSIGIEFCNYGPLTLGIDGTSAISALADIGITDKDLANALRELSKVNPDTEPTETILAWLEKNDPQAAQEIGAGPAAAPEAPPAAAAPAG